jgi:prepilin-type N-terminal cleavage/methylation domain-containing protein
MKTNFLTADMCRKPARGFTLVEMLVTITVILVLAVVAFLSTSDVRSKAQQVHALNALRQIGVAHAAYSTENHGDVLTLRWPGDPVLAGAGGWVGNSFWGRMRPYLFEESAVSNQNQLKTRLKLEINQLFGTPDSGKMTSTWIQGARIYHDTAGLPVPISFNTNMHKWGQFLKQSTFADSSQLIHATYGFGLFNKQHGREYVPLPRGGSYGIYYTGSRKALALYLAGHVEPVSPPMPDRIFE